MGVSVAELDKAVKSLEDAIGLYNASNSDVEKKAFRDAAIQRFEFSIELSWKVSVKALGSTTAAAKTAIREMARNNLINDADIWLKFIDGRNETSHSYDEDVARRVYELVLSFVPYAHELLIQLKKLNV